MSRIGSDHNPNSILASAQLKTAQVSHIYAKHCHTFYITTTFYCHLLIDFNLSTANTPPAYLLAVKSHCRRHQLLRDLASLPQTPTSHICICDQPPGDEASPNRRPKSPQAQILRSALDHTNTY